MKTTGVKVLVHQVLDAMPRPYSVDVIDDVFHAIETNPAWLAKYNALCDELGTTVTNTWSGQWIAHALGKRGERQLPSRKSTLIASYSLLDADARPVLKKPREDDAIKLMADYYRENRASLPADIRKYRDAIIELIMDGAPIEEAFRAVQLHLGAKSEA
jgi:hypothetical protein